MGYDQLSYEQHNQDPRDALIERQIKTIDGFVVGMCKDLDLIDRLRADLAAEQDSTLHLKTVVIEQAEEIERLQELIKERWADTSKGEEVERLKAAMSVHAQYVTENITLRADNERLKAENKLFADYQGSLKNRIAQDEEDNVTLRARVEELEATIQDGLQIDYANADRFNEVCEERDELCTRLAETEEHLKAALEQRDGYQSEMHAALTREEVLESRLASYEKPVPHVVKQTWQVISGDGSYVSKEPMPEFNKLGVIRHDHMSDGTVVATLEQIGETK